MSLLGSNDAASGLNALRRMKRALERQESKSRSGTYCTHHTLTSSDIERVPELSEHDDNTRIYKRKPIAITTGGFPGDTRHESWDLNGLLNSKENEYTRALEHIESLKKSALAVTVHGQDPTHRQPKTCRTNTNTDFSHISPIFVPVSPSWAVLFDSILELG